jgi:hypothetical protein
MATSAVALGGFVPLPVQVTVTLVGPLAAADAEAEKVPTDPAAGVAAAVKVDVTLARALAEQVTEPAKPPVGVMVIATVSDEPPAVSVRLVGAAVIVNPDGALTVRVVDAVCVVVTGLLTHVMLRATGPGVFDAVIGRSSVLPVVGAGAAPNGGAGVPVQLTVPVKFVRTIATVTFPASPSPRVIGAADTVKPGVLVTVNGTVAV